MSNFVKGALIVLLVLFLENIAHTVKMPIFFVTTSTINTSYLANPIFVKKNRVTTRTHLYLFLSRFRHVAIINY